MQTQTFGQASEMDDCIDTCNETHAAALRTLAWFTSEGAQQVDPALVRLVVDCAEVVQTTANFMLRGSPLHTETCKAAEEVCEAVFEACEQSGLDEIEDFKDQVHACAESCREMANMNPRTAVRRNASSETRSAGGRGTAGRSGRGGTGRTRASTTTSGRGR